MTYEELASRLEQLHEKVDSLYINQSSEIGEVDAHEYFHILQALGHEVFVDGKRPREEVEP